MDGIDVRIAGGREGTSTNCAPPSASRFRRFTMAWRMAQAVIAAATSAINIAAVDDALKEVFVSPEDADLERELEALLDPPAPELPDFPSVPVDELSLAGLSLAEDPAPASPVAPARTPVPA